MSSQQYEYVQYVCSILEERLFHKEKTWKLTNKVKLESKEHLQT